MLHAAPMATHPSAPASPPARPACCISAASAPRCSTTCSPATTAASSCCASRTPTANAAPTPRPRASSTGLDWLGLDRDEPDRLPVHARRPATPRWRSELLAAGQRLLLLPARRRNCAQMREQARAEGRPPRYDGRWRDRDPPRRPPGVKPGDPPEGAARRARPWSTTWCRAPCASPTPRLDDMIILRSDGTPTYQHAVVVDDHDMAHHPRDPRRRPPDQHIPPGADLRTRWAGSRRASPTSR